MIERQRSDDCGNEQNFKGMDRAMRHFNAGDLQQIQMSRINASQVYIKGKCMASMKKDIYTVYVCISCQEQESVIVQYGYCQCPVGLSQTCSHVGALLFSLNGKDQLAALQDGNLDSCTSKTCQWIVPRDIKTDPKPISSLNFSKPCHTEPSQITSFDPRLSEQRKFDEPSAMSELFKLKAIFPNTGMCHMWSIPDETPEVAKEVSVNTYIDPMQEAMENLIYTRGKLPVESICSQLVSFIELHTRGQREDQTWLQLHNGRITSSIFGMVLRTGKQPNSLIKQIIEGSNLNRYPTLPTAVIWGIQHEKTAREDYVKVSQGSVLKVENSGLTLWSNYSYLGASSDGTVFQDNQKGCLEIKCPYSLQGQQINKMEIGKILELDGSFCLEKCKTTGEIKLREQHDFYAQVQGELVIKGLPWCDFVVWTAAKTNNIFVQRIVLNNDFSNLMLDKLTKFHKEKIMPLL